MKQVSMKVNGQDYVGNAEPRTLLVYFLRDELGLTGTHIGCVEGKCGACSIIVNGKVIKSCTMFAYQAEGADILTVEGLAKGAQLHPLQDAFWENHALQCGYCTPGMLMSALYLLKTNAAPTEEEIRKGISGNLCMCTGYVNIVKAIKAASEKMAEANKPK